MAETAASYSVPEHHVKMFTSNVKSALTKKGGLITGLVSAGAYQGAAVQVVDFIGTVEFIERNSPYGDTKVTELEHTSRWISGREYDCAVLVDRIDRLKMLYDPTSPYVERMREAAARKMDEIIMSKFFATAKGGVDGTTDIAMPATDIIAHGGTRMTVLKLRALRKLMRKRHIDLRSVKPYIAITAEQADDLLGETTINSADYNAVKPLVDGEVSGFMGFQFIPYEDWNGQGIPTGNDGTAYRQCPVWLSDGMHKGDWDNLNIIVSPRPDKNNIQQIHGTFTFGATRIEEGKVFGLRCAE